MANGHGGSRPGAGRPARAERFEQPIKAAEQQIADRLPELIENQLLLALGGGSRIEERWQAAGTVTVDGFELAESGRAMKVRKPAYPDEEPDKLVLVERKVTTLAPDAQANQYLIDRILGKPAQSVEATVESDGRLKIIVEYADPGADADPDAS